VSPHRGHPQTRLESPSNNAWTVPFGGGVGRITKPGFQPMNINLQFYGNAVQPSVTSPWGMKFEVALLFPKLVATGATAEVRGALVQQRNYDAST
jgi:hypothetical protein